MTMFCTWVVPHVFELWTRAAPPLRAVYVQTAPEESQATGRTGTQVASDEAWEITSISGGEGTSPSRCMKKTCAAIAVARIVGGTILTVAALMGPVEVNRRTSATTVADQNTAGVLAVKTRSATGAAMSVAIPDTHQYACRLRASSLSPSQPPANVPTKPVTTSMAPGSDDARVWETPRTSSRNDGNHAAMPPSAKVYAASPTQVNR